MDYIIDRREPRFEFIFIGSIVLLAVIMTILLVSPIVTAYEQKIRMLQDIVDNAEKRIKIYNMVNEFSEEFGLNEIGMDPGKALSIATVIERKYKAAITQIAIRDNPKLTSHELTSITNTIWNESIKYYLNPLESAAMVHCESGFHIYAISRCKARGLTQLMEETAKAYAPRAGVEWRGLETLYDPVDNLKIGICYLAACKKAYPDLYYAGYNGGPRAVKHIRLYGYYPESLAYQRAVASRFKRYERDFRNTLVKG
jgi:soluble lytic murein transglycosylase-like protein